jgi:hypothetical protein
VKVKVGRSAKLYKRACKCQFFKNSELLSTCLVWKITRTPLPFVDRNNHLSKQFLSLFYKYKALAHVKSLLPSAKGPFFYFYVESSSSIVGDTPNRYTSDVVLNQQARVAHQGGMADSPYRAAQLLKPTWRYWTQALMADPETGP